MPRNEDRWYHDQLIKVKEYPKSAGSPFGYKYQVRGKTFESLQEAQNYVDEVVNPTEEENDRYWQEQGTNMEEEPEMGIPGKLSLSDKAIKRIANFLSQADLEDNQEPIDEVPVEEPTVPQEPGFSIGDETPIGIIRNITQRNGEDIYFVGGNENGAFAQLMNKKDLEDKIYRFTKNEESRLRQEEERAQAESERAVQDDLKGFTDNMPPKTKGIVEKLLLESGFDDEDRWGKSTKHPTIQYKGEFLRKKEYVEKLLEDGYFPATVQGKPAAQREDGVYVPLQKTLYDYLSYLANLS